MLKVTLIVITLLFSNHSYAGFLSTFFANVASDEFKNRNSTDPFINEKKIQASLAVMAFYKGELDGDFNTFESRRGIKAFQKAYGLDTSGFLNDKEKSQLIYLSNLYTSLKYKGLMKKKRNSIYIEIDETKNSLYSAKNRPKNFNTIYVSSDIEDGTVYLEDKVIGKVTLGYIPIKTNRTIGRIRIIKVSEDEELIFKTKGSFNFKGSKSTFIDLVSQKQPSEKKLKKIQNKKAQENMMKNQLWGSGDVIVDNNLFLIWENMPRGNEPRKKTFQDAEAFCKDLEFAKRTDWRLPTLEEALSLMNNGYKVKEKPSKKLNSIYSQTFLFYNSTIKKAGVGSFDEGLIYKRIKSKYYSDNFKCVTDFKNRDKLIAEKRKASLATLNKTSLTESTYIDVENRFLWDLSTKSANHKMSKIKCKISKKDGFVNWRLPKEKELKLLFKTLPYYQKYWFAYNGFFIDSNTPKDYMFKSSSARKKSPTDTGRYVCVHKF